MPRCDSHRSITCATLLSCFVATARRGWILEDMVPPLCKWGPSLRLNRIGPQELLGLTLLKERIHFNLVNRRDHLVVEHEVHDSVRLKIGDANRSDLACGVQVFHSPPLAIHVAKWLMNEIEIEIVQLQSLQGPLKGCQGVVIAVSLDPELGGDEQFFPGDSAPTLISADRPRTASSPCSPSAASPSSRLARIIATGMSPAFRIASWKGRSVILPGIHELLLQRPELQRRPSCRRPGRAANSRR